MKISVIIPTYNRETTIERAIESVLNQTQSVDEIIVIDDGSTDNTQERLKKYDQIKILKTQNQGVSAARNLGITKASSEWLALLDSDDEWLPHKIESQKEFISKNPQAVCVHGDEVWIRNGKQINQMKKHKKGGGDQFIPSLALCLISPSCVLLSKQVVIELGGFREDFVVCEDYDLWLKLTSRYLVGFIDRPLIKKYGGHQDQLSHKYFAMDYYRVKSIAWILENRELTPEKRSAAQEMLLKKCFILIKGYKKHNHQDKLREIEKLKNHFS